ncbi:hypothetical protein [Flavobacterium sp.]|jgi:hypothetical protein|uniref:hypothetical protein n=1 Tax=Flavobacterium sp. TaxID=239 RepID=UPI0037C08594
MKSNIFNQLGEIISFKQYSDSDLLTTSETMNYWRTNDVFPFLKKNRMALMTLPEALWVSIINELSNVGIPADKIEALTNKIWIEPLFSRYADEALKSAIENKKGEHSQEDVEWFKNLLNDEIAMHSVFRRDITPYMDSIKSCLRLERQIVTFIYCPRTEEYLFSYYNKAITSEMNNLFYGETLISIPYLPHLAKLIGLDMERHKEDLQYLSDIENQIRRTIIFDKPKLMEVVVNENGKSKIHSITESHKNQEELAKFF